MGTELRPIPEDVLKVTKDRIDEKRQDPRYAQTEWDYHLRMADRLYPDHAD